MISFRSLLSLLTCSTFFFACGDAPPVDSAPPEAAAATPTAAEDDLVGGRRARRANAVVALKIGTKLCTGAVVGPRSVLTARHCVAETIGAFVCPAQGPQVGPSKTPSLVRVFGGDDIEGAPLLARGASIVVPKGDALCDADVAVVNLDTTLPIEPLLITDTAIEGGDQLVAFGFGKRADGTLGKRYQRTVYVSDVTGYGGDSTENTDVGEDEFTVGASGCLGDDGGPVVGGADENEIYGVLSRPSAVCSGRVKNVYRRADGMTRELVAKAIAAAEADTAPP